LARWRGKTCATASAQTGTPSTSPRKCILQPAAGAFLKMHTGRLIENGMNAGQMPAGIAGTTLAVTDTSEGGRRMNIMSALLRVVGKHTTGPGSDPWWLSISYATGARRVYRHRDSRFIYPPSGRHVHFGATPQQVRQQREQILENASGGNRLLQTR